MKIKQSIAATICGILVASSFFAFNAYAEGGDKNLTVKSAINDFDELNEVDKCLQEFEGRKIKLTSDKKAEAIIAALPALQNEDAKKEARKNKLPVPKDEGTTKPVQTARRVDSMPTLAKYDLDEAKKVYNYSETLIEKIQNNTSLNDEFFYWQVPIINSSNENGTVYLERSGENQELVARALTFGADNREMFLSNEETLDLVTGSIDSTVNIEKLYFIDMPISIMGTVVGTVVLDSGDIMFATVQDVPYYNGMEFKQVYSFDEMMDYLETFAKNAEGWVE